MEKPYRMGQVETVVDLRINDDWNWFQSRNGDNAKLRKIKIIVHRFRNSKDDMLSLKFMGKMGHWLGGGFWVTKDDFFKVMIEVFRKEGYSVEKSSEPIAEMDI